MRVFGAIFGIVWCLIFIVIVSTIIKSVKQSQYIHKTTKDVFSQASNIIKEVSSIKHTYGSPSFDDEDEDEEPSQSGSYNYSPKFSDMNSYQKSKGCSGNGSRKSSSKVYGFDNRDKASHGKLSQESRDDEKNWF